MRNILYFLILFCTVNVSAKEYVYLVDTGYNGRKSCGSYNLTSDRYPGHIHGRNMAKIIIDGIKGDFCIKSYNVYDSKKKTIDVRAIESALLRISNEKPGIVNLSIQGGLPSIREKVLLIQLKNKGFTIHIAAGNNKQDLDENCNSYPACYFTGDEKRVRIVANLGRVSNKNGPVNTIDYKFRQGTSESTAYITHLKLKEVLNEGIKRLRSESLRWLERATRSINCKNYSGPRRTNQDCQEQRPAFSLNELSNESKSRGRCSSRALQPREQICHK